MASIVFRVVLADKLEAQIVQAGRRVRKLCSKANASSARKNAKLRRKAYRIAVRTARVIEAGSYRLTGIA